jgi:hypothetical protein
MQSINKAFFMNKIFTALRQAAFASVILAAATNIVNAQAGGRSFGGYSVKRSNGKNVTWFQRLEFGGGLTFGKGSASSVERYYDPLQPGVVSGSSNTQNFSYRSGCAWINTYFPMTALSHNSILAVSVGLYGNNNSFTLNNFSFNGQSSATMDIKDGFVGLPIGVDYIFCGESTNKQADKVSLRAGIGAMPFISFGSMSDDFSKYSRLGVRPYIKAELGFFAGIEWKIKTQVIVGSRNLYDVRMGDYDLQDGANYYSNFKMDLRPSYSVGIAIMPFAAGWDNDNW